MSKERNDPRESAAKPVGVQPGAVLDAIPAHVAVLDAQGTIVAVNEKWREFATPSPYQGRDHRVGDNYLEICARAKGNNEEGEKVIAGVRAVLAGAVPRFDLIYRCDTKDTHRWFQMMVTPLRQDRGQSAVISHVDVSRVMELEKRFRGVVEATPNAMVVVDRKLRIRLVNSRTENLFGYRRAELLNQPIEMLVPARYRTRHAEHVVGFLAAPESRAMGAGWELFGLRKDGTEVPVEIGLTPINAAEGMFVLASIVDITERKLLERETRRAMKLLDSTLDAMFFFDSETLRFSYVNQGAVDQVGYTRGELLQMTPLDIKPEYDESHFRELLRPLLSGAAASRTFTTIHRRKDGKDIPIEVVLQSVSESAESRTLVSIVRDISERLDNESKLRHAKDLAESANLAKSEFLATMSHELRTPLNGILGMNELLLRTELTERQRRFVEACTTSGRALLQQINDVLDLSKIEAGKLELNVRPCRLESVIFDIVDVFKHVADEKGLTLKCQVDLEACDTVLADDNRLRQILLNLISNALKFTTSGSVIIQSRATKHEPRELTIRFSVTDTGLGIPTERRDRLFAPFSQVDGTTTRRYGGTGLGLYVCKQLVELMNGEIGVESQVGVGSTFWFEVPLQLPDGAAEGNLRHEMFFDMRILAIDGIDENWKQVGECLRAWATRVQEVHTLEESLEALVRAEADNCPFHMVFADCRLIRGDEYALLQQLAGHGVPIIGFCDRASEETTTHLQQFGVRHVLYAPIRPSALFNAMASVLSVADRADRPELQETDSDDSRAKPGISLSGHVLVAEDNRINQMYAVEMLRLCGCTCDVAANGDEAVRAVREKQFDLVLMDCSMPEMDGFAATREIRRWEREQEIAKRLPIVALTARGLKGDREHCLETGMDDYLVKPINSSELRAILERFLVQSPEPPNAGSAT